MGKKNMHWDIGYCVWGCYVFLMMCISYKAWFMTDSVFLIICTLVAVCDVVLTGGIPNSFANPVITACISLGTYTLIENKKGYESLFVLIFAIFLILAFVFSFLFYRINNNHGNGITVLKDKGVYKTLSCLYRRFRYVIAILSIVTIVIVGVDSNHLLENTQYKISDYSCDKQDDSTVSSEICGLEFMRLDNWKSNKNIDIKKAACMNVLSIEKRYLGIYPDLMVEWKDLPQDDCIVNLGSYNDSTRTIFLSNKLISNKIHSANDVLDVLLHEMWHVCEKEYQRLFLSIPAEYRELNIWEIAKAGIFEDESYISGTTKETFSEYLRQGCEVRARNYSRGRREVYESLFERSKEITKEDIELLCSSRNC